jgi:hypothetical protein
MKSYEDPVKEKSREKLREFIRRNVLKYKSPRDVKILCFPGAEQDGQEALEVKSVYDPLRIPRKNILGIEIDKKRYDRLCRANLGIEVLHCSDLDILKNARGNNQTWDVINLDYVSCFNNDRTYAVQLIASDGLLGNRGVVATNFMAKRENRTTHDEFKYALPFIKCDDERTQERLLRTPEYVATLNDHNLNLSEDRSQIIFRRLVSAFSCGKSGLHADFYKTFVDLEPLFKKYEDAATDPDIKYNLELNKGKRRGREEEMLCLRDISVGIYMGFMDRFLESGMDMEQFALFYLLRNEVYFLEDHEAYSYVSNSGSPFFQDMFSFNTYSYRLDRFRNYFQIQGKNPVVIKVLDHIDSPQKYNQIDRDARSLARELWIKRIKARETPINRIFLGSSSRPVLSKKRAIEELMAGRSIEEIQQNYRGWENKPLAQWKAHVTMGTYSNNPEESDPNKPLEVDLEDSELERITKEDVIGLLASGIPAKEIYESYPTSFTKMQLAALKAHMTMGTYK